MATHHGGAGCPLDRGVHILATVALGGPEAVGHPEDPVYDNQDRLTALMREINNLCKRAASGEG